MKLCRFNQDRIGLVLGDKVSDITAIAAPLMARQAGPGDALVRSLPALRERLATATPDAGVALASVRLCAPVGAPGKIIAAPVNYRAHVLEAHADPGIVHGHTQTDIGKAGLFLKANSSLVGPCDGIALRFPDRRNDYEGELVVVIGTGGTDIPAADALSHVAGYAVGLDITLRGPEDRSFRKSIDGYSVMGPWLTTADEIPDPDGLTLTTHQNGQLRQSANTASMVYGVARLIEFASSFYTLHPGDLIFTGTPEGVGPMSPGDILRVEIEGLGVLETVARAHEKPGAANVPSAA